MPPLVSFLVVLLLAPAVTADTAPAQWCGGTVLGLRGKVEDIPRTISRGISAEEGQQFEMPRDGRIVAIRALLWAYSQGHLRMSVFRGAERDFRLYYVDRSLADLPRYGKNSPLEMTTFVLPKEIPVLEREIISVMFEGQPGDRIRSGAVGCIARGDPLKDSKFVYDERFTDWKGSPTDGDDWDYLVSLCIN